MCLEYIKKDGKIDTPSLGGIGKINFFSKIDCDQYGVKSIKTAPATKIKALRMTRWNENQIFVFIAKWNMLGHCQTKESSRHCANHWKPTSQGHKNSSKTR